MREMVKNLPLIATSTLVNSSKVVQRGPCIVLALAVTANGANAVADIYDGVNDKGVHKAKVKAINGTTFSWTPSTGTDFDHGIYIKVDAPTTYVTITFIPESYKKYV